VCLCVCVCVCVRVCVCQDCCILCHAQTANTFTLVRQRPDECDLNAIKQTREWIRYQTYVSDTHALQHTAQSTYLHVASCTSIRERVGKLGDFVSKVNFRRTIPSASPIQCTPTSGISFFSDCSASALVCASVSILSERFAYIRSPYAKIDVGVNTN